MKKSLTVYFTHTGNTRKIAKLICGLTNSDICEIAPVVPYPKDFDECNEIAKKENNNEITPKIENDTILPYDLSRYETIYVGFPSWYRTYPKIIKVFLDNHDTSKCVLKPFVSSYEGDSGIVDLTIKSLGNFKSSIAIKEDNIDEEKIKRWIEL